MNDRVDTLPATHDDRLEALHRQTVSFQAIQAHAWRKSARRSGAGFAVSMALNVVLCGTIYAMMPLKEIKPVYAFYNEAGFPDSTMVLSDLPHDKQVAATEALLWQYVRDREGYAPSEAESDYNIVSELSSDDVKKQYQDWANAKINPNAPAKFLGPNGFIRINRLGSDWVSHNDDYSRGIYSIRFCRVVVLPNKPVIMQRMTANVAFETVKSVPLVQRITSNWVGIVVTEYPGPREDGAEGAVNPCR